MSALNQLYASKEEHRQPTAPQNATAHQPQPRSTSSNNIFAKDLDEAKQHIVDLATTSNHYCIVESDHPYRSATIKTYRVEFPPAVQWFTVEFDPQCGTAQPEDILFVSIPQQSAHASKAKPSRTTDPLVAAGGTKPNVAVTVDDRFTVCRNAAISTSGGTKSNRKNTEIVGYGCAGNDYVDDTCAACVVRQFNTPGAWTQAALVLPGNRIDFTLETATHYTRDMQANKYGFRCLVVGYESPAGVGPSSRIDANGAEIIRNVCLSRLECELAYLGGMCSANLMRKDLVLPGDGTAAAMAAEASDEVAGGCVDDALQTHSALLSKGLSLADSVLTVNQALDVYLPIG